MNASYVTNLAMLLAEIALVLAGAAIAIPPLRPHAIRPLIVAAILAAAAGIAPALFK